MFKFWALFKVSEGIAVPLPCRYCCDAPLNNKDRPVATVTVPLLVKFMPEKVVFVEVLLKFSVAPDTTSKLPAWVVLLPSISSPVLTLNVPLLTKGALETVRVPAPVLIKLPPVCTSMVAVSAELMLALAALSMVSEPPLAMRSELVWDSCMPPPVNVPMPVMRNILLPERLLEPLVPVMTPDIVTMPLPFSWPPFQIKPLAKVALPVPWYRPPLRVISPGIKPILSLKLLLLVVNFDVMLVPAFTLIVDAEVIKVPVPLMVMPDKLNVETALFARVKLPGAVMLTEPAVKL